LRDYERAQEAPPVFNRPSPQTRPPWRRGACATLAWGRVRERRWHAFSAERSVGA